MNPHVLETLVKRKCGEVRATFQAEDVFLRRFKCIEAGISISISCLSLGMGNNSAFIAHANDVIHKKEVEAFLLHWFQELLVSRFNHATQKRSTWQANHSAESSMGNQFRLAHTLLPMS